MRTWVLPTDLTAAGAARDHVTEALSATRVSPDLLDDAILVASELAANGVRHGQPPVVLAVDIRGERVRITVSNHGDSPDPRILTADPHAAHGRGLAMVESLAETVGWERHGDRLDVWAELASS